jgi:hypothetical protein
VKGRKKAVENVGKYSQLKSNLHKNGDEVERFLGRREG